MVESGKREEFERLWNKANQAASEWSERQRALNERLKAHPFVPGEQVILDQAETDAETRRLEMQAEASRVNLFHWLKRLKDFYNES